MRFKRISISNFSLHSSNFKSGSPEDRTQRDPRIRRIWATSPRLPFVIQKVGHLGVEPPVAERFKMKAVSCSQSRRASICTCIRCCLSFSPPANPSAHIFLVSGPGGARILVCGSSDRRAVTIDGASQLPAHVGFVVGVARSVGTRKKARCLRDT